jgi:hypothetical protein
MHIISSWLFLLGRQCPYRLVEFWPAVLPAEVYEYIYIPVSKAIVQRNILAFESVMKLWTIEMYNIIYR